MSYRYLILLLALAIPARAAFAGDTVLGPHCDLKAAFGDVDKNDFLKFDATLRKVLQSGDPTAVALLIKYPLTVISTFPLNDASDASVVQDHFQEIFTPAARETVLKQDLKDITCQAGAIIYRDDKATINVKQVNVEASMEFRVAAVITNSDPKKTGREIVFICHRTGRDIVVDTVKYTDGPARYRAWDSPHTPLDKPDMEMDGGVFDGGGSEGCGRSWTFYGDTTYEVSQQNRCSGDSAPAGAIGYVATSVGHTMVETLWCYP